MTDEEYVRANWERAELCPCPYNNRFNTSLGGRGFTRSNPGEEDTPALAWAAAASFTRERLEQIRLLVLEIEHLCAADYSDQFGEVSDEADQAQERTRLRLADALGELKRGMRTAAPDGARSDAND